MQKSSPHLYQEIAEALRRRIAAGELLPGARLPPVRALAQQWSCTPGTVSRAYRVLAAEGLVTSHRGGGTRVVERPLPTERPFLHWATLVNQAEQFLLTAVSGGHTPAQARSALAVAIARWQTMQQDEPAPPAALPAAAHLRFAGSHDLAVDRLAQHLADQTPTQELQVTYSGSLGGLMALARGEADIAGTHLWDATSNSYNTPFVRRVLPGQRVALLTLVARSLGLALPPGNPQQVQGLADLAQPGIRWVNRQAGSGTRVWLDAQLQAYQIDAAAIPGYEREVTTHMAVAQAVADGTADAGLAIHAAASAYDLDFLPLTQELYQLVVPQPVWETAVCQSLVAAVRSSNFQEAVACLGGYDTTATGVVEWV